MDQQYGIGAIIFALITGFISSWIFWKYQSGRRKAIKQKIEELESEIKFLEKLNSDSNFLRHSFLILFVALAIFFATNVLMSFFDWLHIEGLLLSIAKWLSFIAYAVAAAGCYEAAKALYRLKDINQSREKINLAIEKHRTKLEE